MRAALKFVLVCLAILLCSERARGQEIAVAAAADLKFTMGELAADFEKQTGNKVNVTYGSSGNFFSQIQNGAPFDLFFSADEEYAKKLEAGGLAEPGTLYNYAVGRIVIWMPQGVKVDLNAQGMNALLDAADEEIRDLRKGGTKTGVRREHFASYAVRAVGECAGRNHRVVAGDFPGDEGFGKDVADSHGAAPAD